jgi:hypothetical protein
MSLRESRFLKREQEKVNFPQKAVFRGQSVTEKHFQNNDITSKQVNV